MSKPTADYFANLELALTDFNKVQSNVRATYHSDNLAWKVLVWKISPDLLRILTPQRVATDGHRIGTIIMFESEADQGMIFHCASVSVANTKTYEQALKAHAMDRLKTIQRSFQ